MTEIIDTQVSGGGPTPEGLTTGTNLLLPSRVTSARLAHFPEEVYDLRAESHLVRFTKVLLGDAGAGQLRKRLIQARLQQSLQGIHFHHLDRFYGALFGIRRFPSETLDLDPSTQTATNDVWAIQHAKDASYRSRITQFARSLSFGPTPTGIELISEALLGVDTDVYETYHQSDSGYRTYGELEGLDPIDVTHSWEDTPHNSASVEKVDGVVTRINQAMSPRPDPSFPSSPVEAFRNLAHKPVPNSPTSYNYQESGGEVSVSTLVTGAADGPEVAPGQKVTSYLRRTITTAKTSSGYTGFYQYQESNIVADPGTLGITSAWVRTSQPGVRVRMSTSWRNSTGTPVGASDAPDVTLPANEWVRLQGVAVAAEETTANLGWWAVISSDGTPIEVDGTFDITAVQPEVGSVVTPYHDGDISPDPLLVPSWTGAVGDSATILTATRPGNWSGGGAFLPPYFVTDEEEPAVEVQQGGLGQAYTYAGVVSVPAPGVGQWIAFGVEVKPLNDTARSAMRLLLRTQTSASANVEQVTSTAGGPEWITGQWVRQVLVMQQTEVADNVDAFVWPTSITWAGPTYRARRTVLAYADTEAEARKIATDYFDGDTPNQMNVTLYASLEGMLYSELEGEGLPRMAGDERREFTVRPKRPITPGEAHELTQVLRRVKPADARMVIEADGSVPYGAVPIRGLLSDSDYWEVVPKVVTRDLPNSPYQVVSPSVAVEQPRPPFATYQGEAWSHIDDVIGVAAFESTNPSTAAAGTPMITQRVTLPDGSYLEYPALRALMPRRHLLAGRSASDGALVAHPYWPSSLQSGASVAPLFVDRIPLDSLNALLAQHPIERFPQNPIERFWASPARAQDDPRYEILEVSLSQPRRINYLSVEVAHFPQRVTVQIHNGSTWVTIGTHDITDSIPAYLPPGVQVHGHPQHGHAGHWERLSLNLDQPQRTNSIRFLLQRIPGTAPTTDGSHPVPYSLALRSLDVGYRVRSLDDVPEAAQDGSEPIGATLDQMGSRVEFHLNRLSADRLLTDETAIWRSEPQPVNYAVVNLYVDLRTDQGDAQVLDTLYLDPVHSGAHLSVYWTEDVGEPTGCDWYEARQWHPVDGDYRVHKGYVHLPPIAARHLKLEFTALSAEPHSTLLPLTRTIKFFPQWLIQAYAHRGALSEEGMPAGLRTSIDVGDDLRYADALSILAQSTEATEDPTQYLPTEAIFTTNTEAARRLVDESWAFGFTPWHQGTEAPRFPTVGVHEYQTVEMQHATQMGFFVGLRDLKVLRTDPTADDDSLLYDEFFHDFRQIEPGLTWTFEPGRLETVLQNDCVATSRVYQSRANVWAVQFATQQTDPVQVVPDDDMRDPALATIDWYDNPDGWHQVGDATVVYSPQNHSARLVRYAQPPMRPTNVLPGLVQEPHHEVFSYRKWVTGDSTQTAESFGGIESPLLGVSAAGVVYGAVRMTFISAPTSPMLLQVLDGDTGDPLFSHEITGAAGETIERFYPFPLSGSSAVRIRLVQQGISNDLWEVDRLSLFDPGIQWEFSVDGGETWVGAGSVRNNAHGIVTFPRPGNQLVWRATGMRPRMSISALRIRPLYQGVQNARYNGVQRGPNVSSYDVGLPITEDPMFNTWSGPIPRDWFLAYRQFPTLVSADGPTVTEFARFYGRPIEDTLAEPTDVAIRAMSFKRAAGDLAWVDDQTPTFDGAVRTVSFVRSGTSTLPTPVESAWALVVQKSTWGPHNVPVHRP